MDATTSIERAIPCFYLPEFEKELKALNRKSQRLGLPATTYTVQRAEVRRVEVGYDKVNYKFHYRRIKHLILSIAGPVVALPGYAFIAALEPAGAVGSTQNIVRTAPGATLPEHYRTAPMRCDHCGTARKRAKAFVLRSEAGVYVQVGSGCLQDFTGCQSGELLAAQLAHVADIFASGSGEEGWAGDARLWAEPEVRLYLCYVLASVAERGYVKAKDAPEGQRPTGLAAWLECTHKDKAFDADDKVLAEHGAQADAVLAYWHAQPGRSDFEHNVKLIFEGGFVGAKHCGYAAGAVAAYQRAVGAERERAAQPISEYVGTVGQRVRDVPVTVLNVRQLPDSDYGYRQLITYLTEGGAVLKWFTSGLADDKTVGSRLLLTATVKAHNEYNGRRETTIARATLVLAGRSAASKATVGQASVQLRE